MRNFRRIMCRSGLGSARVWRVWFRRRAETSFPLNVNRRTEPGVQEKFAIAERAHQTRETRALPRALRSRSLVVCAVIALAVMLSILCTPLPRNLQQPLAGTLTLLDCRGREIAEIASPEARAQLPRGLDELGKWLPAGNGAVGSANFMKQSLRGKSSAAGARNAFLPNIWIEAATAIAGSGPKRRRVLTLVSQLAILLWLNRFSSPVCHKRRLDSIPG